MKAANVGEKMDPSQMSAAMKQQVSQKLTGDLLKPHELLSNMITSVHDIQMTPVRDIRG
jgi:hypothetical protein